MEGKVIHLVESQVPRSRGLNLQLIIVHENSSILSPHPEKSDVQGFMIDSGPKLSPEHDRLSWTRFRFGQLALIGR